MKWRCLILCAGLMGCEINASANPAQTTFERLVQAGQPTIIASVETTGTVAAFARVADSGGVETWISGDGVSLSFRNGVLTATRGFGWDLMTADLAETAALIRRGDDGAAVRIHRYLDGEDHLVARSFVCDVRRRGSRELNIGADSVQTVLFEETCTGTEDDFRNLYWIDQRDPAVVQSRQWVGPAIGSLALRGVRR